MFSEKPRFYLRFVLYTLITLGCLLLTWSNYSFSYTGIDDANIYFVYMDHLAKGHGFVYNIGGERVEGFTSFFWTLLGGLIFTIFTRPEQIILLLNFSIISLGLGYFLAKTDVWTQVKSIVSLQSLAILAFLYLIPGYFDWTGITLLETGIWSISLMFCLINLIDYELQEDDKRKSQNVKLAALLFLLPAIRPEAIVFGGFFAVIRIIQGIVFKTRRNNMLPLIALIISVAALTLFRIEYFGFPLPNTYYAKVSSNKNLTIKEGISYFYKYSYQWNYLFFLLAVQNIVALIFGLITLAIKRLRTSTTRILIILSAISLLSLLIPLYSGGDHFFMGRFFQPLMPVMLFLLCYGFYNILVLSNVKSGLAKWCTRLIPISIIALFIGINPIKVWDFNNGKRSDIAVEFDIVDDMKNRARRIETFFATNQFLPSVGVSAAGSFAYNYKGKTIDLMGLNNVEMAHKTRVKLGLKNHSSFNIDVFLKQKPDIFLYSYCITNDSSSFHFQRDGFYDWIYKGILDKDEFKALYYPVWIKRKDNGTFFHSWISRDFSRKIDSNKFEVMVIPVY